MYLYASVFIPHLLIIPSVWIPGRIISGSKYMKKMEGS
jgi:hypothetical protein